VGRNCLATANRAKAFGGGLDADGADVEPQIGRNVGAHGVAVRCELGALRQRAIARNNRSALRRNLLRPH